MTRVGTVLLLVIALATAAAAQDVPPGFPIGKTFRVLSIGGSDVQSFGITLTVMRTDGTRGLRGAGHAGCNGWTGTVMLRGSEFQIGRIATTRKHCGEPRMSGEQAFLTALQSVRRWNWQADRLLLAGDGQQLLLMPAAAADAGGGKSDKNRANR